MELRHSESHFRRRYAQLSNQMASILEVRLVEPGPFVLRCGLIWNLPHRPSVERLIMGGPQWPKRHFCNSLNLIWAEGDVPLGLSLTLGKLPLPHEVRRVGLQYELFLPPSWRNKVAKTARSIEVESDVKELAPVQFHLEALMQTLFYWV